MRTDDANKVIVCTKCRVCLMSSGDLKTILGDEFFAEPSFAVDPKQLGAFAVLIPFLKLRAAGKLMGAELKDMAPSDSTWNSWVSQAKIPFQGCVIFLSTSSASVARLFVTNLSFVLCFVCSGHRYTRGDDMPAIGWLVTALNNLLSMMKQSAKQPCGTLVLQTALSVAHSLSARSCSFNLPAKWQSEIC